MPQYVMFRQDQKYVYSREAIVRRTPVGDLMCVWLSGGPREPDNTNVVPCIRSRDDGRTWTYPFDLFTRPDRACWCTELYSTTERVYAFVQTYEAATRYHFLASHLAESRDDGRTFGPMIPLNGDWLGSPRMGRGWLGGLNVRQGIRTHSGKHLFAVNWYEPARSLPPDFPVKINTDGAGGAFAYTHTFYCGVLETRDFSSFRLHGRIQRRADVPWAGPTPDVPLHEPNIVETQPGHLVMLIRGEHSRTLWQAESSDDGLSWSDAYPIAIPNPGSKLRFLKVSDSEYVLIHNPNPARRTPLEIWFSSDHLKTWRVHVPVDPAEVGSTTGKLQYPDGFIDSDRDSLYFAWEDHDNIFLDVLPLSMLRRG